MHLSDSELRESLDAELPEQMAVYASAHLDECAQCEQRRRGLRVEDEEIQQLLLLTCPPVPEVSVEALIARTSRGGRRRRVALAAAAALAAATAAAAVPGSPLRVYVERAVLAVHSVPSERPNVASQPKSVARPHGATGIVYRPIKTTEIVFLSRQASGSARVTFSDTPEVRVTHAGGAVSYRLDRDELTIVNTGSVANFSLTLPRWIASARIRAGTRTLLHATSGQVTTAVRPDSSGAYVIELSTYPKE